MTESYADLALDAEADQCARWIIERQGAAGLRPTNLQDRLVRTTGLAALGVARALRALNARGLVTGVDRSGRPRAMVRWIGPVPMASVPVEEQEWRELVDEFADGMDAGAHALLVNAYGALAGLEREDKKALLQGMLCMRRGGANSDPWVWSATHLLGSSKAARNLRNALAALGVEAEAKGGQYYVITAGPANPDAVVLIENPRVFSAVATCDQADRILAVATYGYGLTMENFGQRLIAGDVVACPASGERVDLREMISRCPWYFWGDLDQEGLRIFQTLRQQLPELRLSAAYNVMDLRLDNRLQCHPYHALFEKNGQRTVDVEGGDPLIGHLAARCTYRAVDQEAIVRLLREVDLSAPYERR